MNVKLHSLFSLKNIRNPISAPTLYRIRFYTRRFLRNFRHAKPRKLLLAFLSFIILISTYISIISSLLHKHTQPTDNSDDSISPTLYEVSTARVNITPHEPVFLSGFASRTAAPKYAKLLDPSIPLFSRALAIRHFSSLKSAKTNATDSDDLRKIHTTLIFISLDIIAIPRSLSDRIHSYVQSVYKIPPSHVVLCASHTHSGPAIGDALNTLSPTDSKTEAAILRYEAYLEKSIIHVISTVLQPLNSHSSTSSFYSRDTNYARSATASFMQTSVPLAVNRRQVNERTYVKQFEQSNTENERGDTNDIVPFIIWKDAASGTLIAGIFGFSAHPTILTQGNKYSGDYPAVSAHLLEHSFISDENQEEQHPMWLFASGVAGDQNIYPRGSRSLLIDHSKKLADAIVDTITDQANQNSDNPDSNEDNGMMKRSKSSGDGNEGGSKHGNDQDTAAQRNGNLATSLKSRFPKTIQGDLQARHKMINLPFATRYTASELRSRARRGGKAERRAVRVIIPKVSPSDKKTASSYEYPITVWKIGNINMAFLGGEPTVGYSRLLNVVGVDWVVGYCNDVMGYVGTSDVIRSGGREGGERAAWYYGLPSKWSVRVQDILVHTVEQLVDSVLSASPNSMKLVPPSNSTGEEHNDIGNKNEKNNRHSEAIAN